MPIPKAGAAQPNSGKFEVMGAPARWCIRNDVLIVERQEVDGGYAQIFLIPVDGIAAAVRAAKG